MSVAVNHIQPLAAAGHAIAGMGIGQAGYTIGTKTK